MGKREDQAKLRKKYRRGRYARFTGSTTRFAVRHEERLLREGDLDESGKPVHFRDPETQVRVKEVKIFVGPVSFSNQVVNGGKSYVNTERMESYYERIRTKDQPLTIAEIFGVKNSKYQQVWDETPFESRVNFYSNELGRLDMYWSVRRYFFVEIDIEAKVIKRSRDYGSPQRAKDAELYDNIRWVEKIPIA